MFLDNVCMPVIIYIIFSIIQIFIDLYNKLFKSGLEKFIFMIIISLMLNILCNVGLTFLAWIIILFPFIYLILILILTFGSYKSSTVSYNDLSNNNLEIQNNIIDIERIDRDTIRKDFYDDVDEFYDLSYSEANKYDLSNNRFKYALIDLLINKPVNNGFVEFIYNKQLFNYIIPEKYLIYLNVKNSENNIRNYNNKMREFYILQSMNYKPCPNNELGTSYFRKNGYDCGYVPCPDNDTPESFYLKNDYHCDKKNSILEAKIQDLNEGTEKRPSWVKDTRNYRTISNTQSQSDYLDTLLERIDGNINIT
tara:strand:+ start:102 stop:1028 length:927 start_codon:yes stop_codon:yes gene_type:complete